MTNSVITPPKAGLQRRIGFWLLLLYGLGNILGAGIYVLIGKVAGEAGYGTPLAFLIAAAAAAFTVFTYAELSARYPVSAGEAVYLYHGFKLKWLSIAVGVLLVLSGVLSAATISHGFVGYFQLFFTVPEWALITLLIITLGVIATWGIGESVKVAALLTLFEAFGLILIIFVGMDKLMPVTAVITPSEVTTPSFYSAGILLGAYLAFYAFIGFEDMVNIAEEVEQPQRNLPLATVIALLIASVIYGLISWIAINVVTPSELALSDAPLALVYERASGNSPALISIISLFAVVNGALIQIIMGSRILFGMSRNHWIPAALSQVNSLTHTPVLATIVITALTLFFALVLPMVKLAELTSFLVLTIFALINGAMIQIRKKSPKPDGVKVFPGWIAYAGLIISIGFIVTKLVLTL